MLMTCVSVRSFGGPFNSSLSLPDFLFLLKLPLFDFIKVVRAQQGKK